MTTLTRADGSVIQRPTTLRRLWVPGIQYEGESQEQMLEREQLCREDDARADAAMARLLQWKLTPWWEDPPIPPTFDTPGGAWPMMP